MQTPKSRTSRYPFAILFFAAISALALVAPASAGMRIAGPAGASMDEASPDDASLDDGEERHCVAYAQDASSTAKVAEPRCWDDASEAEAFVASITAERAGSRAGGNNVIGRHYSGSSYTGSSVTVVGTTCAGGTWPASGWWNNKISSSGHYCGSSGTRFYDSSSCSGSGKTIYGWASGLGSMDNKTSCVRYG